MSLTEKQKQFVRERAGYCCEYCRLSQSGRLAKFHVDHIIAEKHDGDDSDTNLCLACPKCNAFKGDNVAAIDSQTGEATKLYNPRKQRWADHFKLNDDAIILGLSPEGRTTIAVLRINDEVRVKQRYGELQLGDYPCNTD